MSHDRHYDADGFRRIRPSERGRSNSSWIDRGSKTSDVRFEHICSLTRKRQGFCSSSEIPKIVARMGIVHHCDKLIEPRIVEAASEFLKSSVKLLQAVSNLLRLIGPGASMKNCSLHERFEGVPKKQEYRSTVGSFMLRADWRSDELLRSSAMTRSRGPEATSIIHSLSDYPSLSVVQR